MEGDMVKEHSIIKTVIPTPAGGSTAKNPARAPTPTPTLA